MTYDELKTLCLEHKEEIKHTLSEWLEEALQNVKKTSSKKESEDCSGCKMMYCGKKKKEKEETPVSLDY
jgi:hypothetical protein